MIKCTITSPLQIIKTLGIQTIPDLWWFNLGFFGSKMVQKRYAFSKICTLNFDLFPIVICCMILSHDAGQRQGATAPSVTRSQRQTANTFTTIIYP